MLYIDFKPGPPCKLHANFGIVVQKRTREIFTSVSQFNLCAILSEVIKPGTPYKLHKIFSIYIVQKQIRGNIHLFYKPI